MKVGSWLILMTMLAQSEDNQLPRRGYFGVGLEKAENGARVFSVAPDSTAAAVKIVVDDVIEAVDGRPGTTPEAVVALIGRHKGGESIKIDIRREGNRRTIDVILKRYPVEQMANRNSPRVGLCALVPNTRPALAKYTVFHESAGPTTVAPAPPYAAFIARPARRNRLGSRTRTDAELPGALIPGNPSTVTRSPSTNGCPFTVAVTPPPAPGLFIRHPRKCSGSETA